MFWQDLHLTTNKGFKTKGLQLDFNKHLEYHKKIIKYATAPTFVCKCWYMLVVKYFCTQQYLHLLEAILQPTYSDNCKNETQFFLGRNASNKGQVIHATVMGYWWYTISVNSFLGRTWHITLILEKIWEILYKKNSYYSMFQDQSSFVGYRHSHIPKRHHHNLCAAILCICIHKITLSITLSYFQQNYSPLCRRPSDCTVSGLTFQHYVQYL